MSSSPSITFSSSEQESPDNIILFNSTIGAMVVVVVVVLVVVVVVVIVLVVVLLVVVVAGELVEIELDVLWASKNCWSSGGLGWLRVAVNSPCNGTTRELVVVVDEVDLVEVVRIVLGVVETFGGWGGQAYS